MDLTGWAVGSGLSSYLPFGLLWPQKAPNPNLQETLPRASSRQDGLHGPRLRPRRWEPGADAPALLGVRPWQPPAPPSLGHCL